MTDASLDPRTSNRGGACPRTTLVEVHRPRSRGGQMWGRVLLAATVLGVMAAPALAQPRTGGAKPPKPPAGDKVLPGDAAPPKPPAAGPTSGPHGKPKVFDFTGLDLAGRLRTPQLLYFLDRASEELERASLERRSFIPAMVRSIDESDL